MFKDLDEFLDDGSSGLELPIGGKVYKVPDLDGPTGLWAERLAAALGRDDDEGADALDDGDERILAERMLGSALEEMVADGVAWPKIRIAGMTAFFYHVDQPEAARRYWEAGGNPEAAGPAEEETQPNRASRRASAAAARTTRKRASGSGTKAKASKPSSGKKAGSPGRKSSTSGS